jgi:hypothetical protein
VVPENFRHFKANFCVKVGMPPPTATPRAIAVVENARKGRLRTTGNPRNVGLKPHRDKRGENTMSEAKKSTSYMESKLRQLNDVATYRIYGHMLEFGQDGPAAAVAKNRRWSPISPCLCVWDSPESPCPCDYPTRWWLPDDAIVAHGRSGRKDQEGSELEYFDVLVESNIMIESLHAVRAGAIKNLGNRVTPQRIFDLATESVRNEIPYQVVPFIKDILVGLFTSLVYDRFKEGDTFVTDTSKLIADLIENGWKPPGPK